MAVKAGRWQEGHATGRLAGKVKSCIASSTKQAMVGSEEVHRMDCDDRVASTVRLITERRACSNAFEYL